MYSLRSLWRPAQLRSACRVCRFAAASAAASAAEKYKFAAAPEKFAAAPRKICGCILKICGCSFKICGCASENLRLLLRKCAVAFPKIWGCIFTICGCSFRTCGCTSENEPLRHRKFADAALGRKGLHLKSLLAACPRHSSMIAARFYTKAAKEAVSESLCTRTQKLVLLMPLV